VKRELRAALSSAKPTTPPQHVPALLCGTPALLMGQREFAAEVSGDLPSLAPGATSLLDATVTGCRQGYLAYATLASSTRFVEFDAAAWSNNTVLVMARDTSPSATFGLGAGHAVGHGDEAALALP
jgi:hypothetical protein